MAIYTLLENDNLALTIPLSGCSEDLDRKELKENLTETMKNFHGIGLSASQCGVMERVFVMYSDVKKKEIIACFNPQIISEGTEMVIMDEGCLTWPGIWVKIRRPDHIRCSFEDEYGELGLYGNFSSDLPLVISPYTSSVEIWTSFIFFLLAKIDSNIL